MISFYRMLWNSCSCQTCQCLECLIQKATFLFSMRPLGLQTEHTKSVENVTPIFVHHVELKRRKNTWSMSVRQVPLFNFCKYPKPTRPPHIHTNCHFITQWFICMIQFAGMQLIAWFLEHCRVKSTKSAQEIKTYAKYEDSTSVESVFSTKIPATGWNLASFPSLPTNYHNV